MQKKGRGRVSRESRTLLGDGATELILKGLDQLYKIDYYARKWFMS